MKEENTKLPLRKKTCPAGAAVRHWHWPPEPEAPGLRRTTTTCLKWGMTVANHLQVNAKESPVKSRVNGVTGSPLAAGQTKVKGALQTVRLRPCTSPQARRSSQQVRATEWHLPASRAAPPHRTGCTRPSWESTRGTTSKSGMMTASSMGLEGDTVSEVRDSDVRLR